MIRIFVLFAALVGLSIVLAADNKKLHCSEAFCQDYRENVGCPKMAVGCVAQNGTHSGTIFSAASQCNCCTVCMEHINEGEYCAIGEPGAPTPKSFCGPGLTCKRANNEEHPRCYLMDNTKCTRQRNEYDQMLAEHSVDALMQRPSCNADGMFNPVICIPGQICFCVDENGDRIFGEDVHSDFNWITMKCECSRMHRKLQIMMDASGTLNNQLAAMASRCLDDGSFDPLQCMDGSCVCVKRYFGTLDADVNGDRNVPVVLYNQSVTSFSEMSCFDHELHHQHKYLHDCEAKHLQMMTQVQNFLRTGITVLDFSLDICEPNGWYKSVQQDSDWIFCANKSGVQIGNYRASRKSVGGHRMNCHCARSETIAPDTTPSCCRNGNYPSMRCEKDQCFCLNENGEQTSVGIAHSMRSQLACYSSAFEADEYGQEGSYCDGRDNDII